MIDYIVWCWICNTEMIEVEEDLMFCPGCLNMHIGDHDTIYVEAIEYLQDTNCPQEFIDKHGVLGAYELWESKREVII